MVTIQFEIEALENIKIGESNRQSDQEYSLDYIPGSAIRGAIIQKYLVKYPHIDLTEDVQSRALFLEGAAKFLNAYPIDKEQSAIPFPLCLYAEKDELKTWDGQSELSGIQNEIEAEVVTEGYKKVKPAFFMAYDKKKEVATYLTVKKSSSLHINKQKNKNNIFRYEAIEKGQNFMAFIQLEEKNVSKMVELLGEKIFYIGGSKGSGYGKCQICHIEQKKELPYAIQKGTEEKFQQKFCIYALSDIFYKNIWGEVQGFIEPEELEKELDVQGILLQKVSTENSIISGYNTKWQSRVPQYKGIQAGSVFLYSYEGKLSLEKVVALMQKGIGQRKAEGYGQIAILPSFSIKKLQGKKQGERKERALNGLTIKEEEVLKQILQGIYQSKIEKAIDTYIYKQIENIRIPHTLNKNQLSNSLELICFWKTQTYDKAQAAFNAYEKKQKEKINQYTIEKLKGIHIGKHNFVDYLTTHMQKSDDVAKLNQLLEIPSLQVGKYKVELTKQQAHMYRLEMLEKLLRYILRIEGHEREVNG